MSCAPRSNADRFVLVTEVGTRDGFQSEKQFVPTETKAALINALIDAGVKSFEATSFVSPRAVPQMADASEVMALIHRKPGVRLTAMRNGPPAGAQIEYERRTSSPPMSVRSVRCWPGSKRNSSRNVCGTSNVTAIASRVSRSTLATGSAWNLLNGTRQCGLK